VGSSPPVSVIMLVVALKLPVVPLAHKKIMSEDLRLKIADIVFSILPAGFVVRGFSLAISETKVSHYANSKEVKDANCFKERGKKGDR